ncbi:MAG TPA: 3-hydroxyacyl-CoA dehydrogenase family protein, partial [Kofleriaceae bacterium]|nr:3-hydroxyacyl-CoA dehydrogenase family protein [Kofleriaceae bacterium]
SVSLTDAIAGAAGRALERIAKNLARGVELGKVAAADRDAALARIAPADDLAVACSRADAVIEAVPEQLELKHEIFTAVDTSAPAHALLASNTSSLSIAEIAAAVRDPARVVGMHFFNPVHLMKLVEVVRHPAADDSAVEAARAFSERLGKTPIVVSDSPGFASSRLGLVLGLEAIRMVESGVASAADIDTAMKLGYGHPMGPLELTDLVGLDVRLGIADYLAGELGAGFTPPALLRRLVAEGKLGKKSGEGFYRWDATGKKIA